ncbi:hypothetical protein [Paracidovorax avenae]|nr:hypothetical protein [Paracidovorax avenae]
MPPAAFPHRAMHVSDPYGTHGASHRGGGGLHDWLANRDDRAMGRPARTSAFTPPASAAAVHAWPEARPASPPTGRPARSEAPAAPAQHEEFSFNPWAQQPTGRTQRASPSASAQRPARPEPRTAEPAGPLPRRQLPLEERAANYIKEAMAAPTGDGKLRIDHAKAVGAMGTELQADLRQGMRQASAGSTRLQGVDKRLADAFADALKELGADGHRLPAQPLVTEKALQMASERMAREVIDQQLARMPVDVKRLQTPPGRRMPPPPTLESSAASWLANLRSKQPERPDALSASSAAAAFLADDLLRDLEKARLSVFGGKVYLDDDLEPRLAGALLSALEEGASQGYDLSSHESVLQQAKRKAARQVANRLIDQQLQKERAEAPRASASPSPVHAGTSAGRQLPLEAAAANYIRESTTVDFNGKPRVDLTKALRFMGSKMQTDLRQCMRQAPAGSTRLPGVDQRLADAFAHALKELGADGRRLPANPLVTEKALQLASSRVAREVLMQELLNGHRNANIAEPPEKHPSPQPPLGSRVASLLAGIREDRSRKAERPDASVVNMIALAVLEEDLQKDLEKVKLSVVGGRVRLDDVDPRIAEAVDSALQEEASQGYELSNHDAVLQQAKRKAAKQLAKSLVGEQLRKEASEAQRRAARDEPSPAEFSFSPWLSPGSSGSRRS